MKPSVTCRLALTIALAALFALPCVDRAEPQAADLKTTSGQWGLANAVAEPRTAAKLGGGEQAETGSVLTAKEAEDLVKRHNGARGELKIADVKWSPTVAKYAQEWADEVAKAGKIQHRPKSKYGENLASGTGNLSVLSAANAWCDEKRDYTPGTPIPVNFADFKSGHYSQMIWRATTEIGAGKATIQIGDKKGWTLIVCNYNPRGNITGKVAESSK